MCFRPAACCCAVRAVGVGCLLLLVLDPGPNNKHSILHNLKDRRNDLQAFPPSLSVDNHQMIETISSLVPTLLFYIISAFVSVLIPYAIYEYACAKIRGDCFVESYPFQTSLEFWTSSSQNDLFLQKSRDMETNMSVETCCFNLFGLPWLAVTNDVQNITHILKNVNTYGKGPKWNTRMYQLLGNGIFSADGDLWYKHRKTSSHLFNLNKFRTEMSHTFNEHCTTLIKCIIDKSKAGSSIKEVAAFDLQDLFLKFTLDSIGKIAFGKTVGALQKDRVLFAESFDFCQFQANASFTDPLWLLKRYCTPTGWQFHRHINRVNKFAYDLVIER